MQATSTIQNQNKKLFVFFIKKYIVIRIKKYIKFVMIMTKTGGDRSLLLIKVITYFNFYLIELLLNLVLNIYIKIVLNMSQFVIRTGPHIKCHFRLIHHILCEKESTSITCIIIQYHDQNSLGTHHIQAH